MIKISTVIVIFLVTTTLSFGQAMTEPVNIVMDNAAACELNSLYVDMISVDASANRKRIFVIFRRGQGETETVNAKRLAHVRSFLRRNKRWDMRDVVYARGENTDGQPRIDFYLGGPLFLTTFAKRNMTPCMDCCDGDFLEVPQNLTKKPKAKTKSTRKP